MKRKMADDSGAIASLGKGWKTTVAEIAIKSAS